MLGNIEEIRDYHKHVMLPRMEKAVDNAGLMRSLLLFILTFSNSMSDQEKKVLRLIDDYLSFIKTFNMSSFMYL